MDNAVIDEEALFSRDLDGQLVRMTAATQAGYDDYVVVTFVVADGAGGRESVEQHVVVPRAVPRRDAQGNMLRDKNNESVPRATTVLDAYLQLTRDTERLELRRRAQGIDARPHDIPQSIPVLCHQEHMTPVGVCRVCAVSISRRQRDGTVKPGRKLVPSCQHLVEDGMVVHTIHSIGRSGDEIRASVKMLAELLVANSVHPAVERQEEFLRPDKTFRLPQDVLVTDSIRESRYQNELLGMAAQVGLENVRFSRRSYDVERLDTTSPVILVDHNQCILCNRCVRACNEVRPFHVIGRTGKGTQARIGFDLNLPMGESDCVSCGECMISCPTGVLTFRDKKDEANRFKDEQTVRSEPVSTDELRKNPLFAGLPYSFLKWNEAAARRRFLADGELLCREGENGSTAYIIESGTFTIFGSNWTVDRDWRDIILGEMACMNNQPRTASIRAKGPAQILEIRRNILYVLQRSKEARDILDQIYKVRAIEDVFGRQVRQTVSPTGYQRQIFESLEPEQRSRCVDFFRQRADLLRVEPGVQICREGERAEDFFIVRLGAVRVFRQVEDREVVIDYLRPGRHFGEIALVSQVSKRIRQEFPQFAAGKRTSSCSALDHVEVVRIRRSDFAELLEQNPDILERLENYCLDILRSNTQRPNTFEKQLDRFLSHGIYQGQKLMVINLDSCTRCDECTKACANSHDGHNRLVREGIRFENWLVASACRSCHDPRCLVGCPVDAIHRDATGGLAIHIEDHCIGCGLCSSNCPFGNIQMVPHENGTAKARRAITCDLCESVPWAPGPLCVHACPHDCAKRMSAEVFWEKVYQ